jgi:hypothetical protein
MVLFDAELQHLLEGVSDNVKTLRIDDTGRR